MNDNKSLRSGKRKPRYNKGARPDYGKQKDADQSSEEETLTTQYRTLNELL